MPIKTKNKHYYTGAWRTHIRPSILFRADHRCERCAKPNGEVVLVRPTTGHWYDMDAGTWRDEHGIPAPIDAATDFRAVRVVLTVAHLDQDPANNSPDNLAALCQRCHLNHDRKRNMEKAAQTRQAKKAG